MRIGILCGGGPAPGFNGVIHAVVNAASRHGDTVIGIPDGYKHLMAGNTDACYELTPAHVAGIATTGGGILRTNRGNPKKSPETMDNVVASVKALGLDALVTIGGDDTATSAANVAAQMDGKLRIAHVPKTIDNDLPLPGMAPTFGYNTAADLGATLCSNLRVDALTTSRWYFVTAMGRSAGHLALSMADGASADLCLIREEFEESGATISQLADTCAEAIRIRSAAGQAGGLIVLAEGILEKLDPSDLASAVGELELDEHGNPRMSEIDLGKAIRDAVQAKLGDDAPGFVTKIIGYELRCADPVAFDVQYTSNLGAAAVAFLRAGEGNGIIAIANGNTQVLRFEDLWDEATGRIPVRRVDLNGAAWQGSLALQARA